MRWLALALMFAAPVQAETVTVFAAASLKTALDEVAAGWQASTGTSVSLSYGGSPAMARQIEQGAPADIFISAAPEWMDVLEDAGLTSGPRVDLLGNRLVLIATGQAAEISLDQGVDLGQVLGDQTLAMAMVEAVPAGVYGKQALTHYGLWDNLAPKVVQTENVRQALGLVASGEAAMGIVYASDAVAEPGVSVIFAFPPESHAPIIYPAVLIGPAPAAAAQAFLDQLSGPDAAAIFAAQGFEPLNR